MEISHSNLGKSTEYPERYNKDILFPIARKANRELYDIDTQKLPFTGWDVWNCYEISFLTNNNFPVNGILKIIYSAESEFIVESKSLKLYLYSFNMEKLGKTQFEAIAKFEKTVECDLSEILNTPVKIQFHQESSHSEFPFSKDVFNPLDELVSQNLIENKEFNSFSESPQLLSGKKSNETHTLNFQTNLLRSNCPVTHQPDWGDLFCHIKSDYILDIESIIAYIISFRKENHFHEEIAEMIFKRLSDHFQPEELMVAALYTRRGGIDINPIRASHKHLIPKVFTSKEILLEKTFRQ